MRGPGGDRSWPPEPAGTVDRSTTRPGAQIDYFDGSDQLFVDYEQPVPASCARLARGSSRSRITGSEPGDEVLATHPLLTIALVETMKRFGRFPLHAAGLALDGKGVLVPGASGSGKSTTSVTLVRAGFDFLSDDTVFLTSSTDGIWVAGFPDEVDVTENTVAMIPELGHLAGVLPAAGSREAQLPRRGGLRHHARWPAAVRPSCSPPRWSRARARRSNRSAPSEALMALLPNVLLTDPVASQAHLDMLAELVESVPCLRFRVGSDLDAAAACVTDLVS